MAVDAVHRVGLFTAEGSRPRVEPLLAARGIHRCASCLRTLCDDADPRKRMERRELARRPTAAVRSLEFGGDHRRVFALIETG